MIIVKYIWADLAHLMIKMLIILAKINVNFGQNDQYSDHQMSQIHLYEYIITQIYQYNLLIFRNLIIFKK
jgi:hypothetical protein